MQYRLSTLFLIFFVVAATLALFGTIGLWMSFIILFIAFQINHLKKGLTLGELFVEIAVIGLLYMLIAPMEGNSREKIRIQHCVDNLTTIGQALHHYQKEHGQFPMATTKSENGQSLWSWRVEILPELGYDHIFNQLKNNEPWNSPHNLKKLDQNEPTKRGCFISEYSCPSACDNNYVAIVGPGTAWRENKPIQLSDLPDGGSHTVMILEMLNPGKHWCEPDSISVDELLSKLNTSHETNIMSYHPGLFNALLADGSVWQVPSDMPISSWQKILAGEFKSVHDLNSTLDSTTSGMAKVSYHASNYDRFLKSVKEKSSFLVYLIEKGPNVCAILVWLLSLILLFRRAIKSRKPVEIAKMENVSSPPG